MSSSDAKRSGSTLFSKEGTWSRGQTDIYGLFCEFVAPPRKKNLVTIFSKGMSWSLRNPCFTKISVVSFL